MATSGLYRGFAETKLVEMREDRMRQLNAAFEGRVDNIGKSGSTVGKTFASVAEIKRDLAEINAELRRIDPDTYGRKITRLQANFLKGVAR